MIGFPKEFSLEAVRELDELVGRPERGLRLIHIAGTNGKGSVGAYLANALACSGYRVGRFLSPAVDSEAEQIQKIEQNEAGLLIQWIDQAAVDRQMKRITEAVHVMQSAGHELPSDFERLTVMAFLQLAEWQVDFAIIEAGLGGDTDATNIIEHPSLAVFTSISLDHTAYLGDTLLEIAGHKFGIIKEGVPVVCAMQAEEVLSLCKERCRQLGCSWTVTAPEELSSLHLGLSATEFSYRGEAYRLSQLGRYQVENALTAIDAYRMLMKREHAETAIDAYRMLIEGENAESERGTSEKAGLGKNIIGRYDFRRVEKPVDRSDKGLLAQREKECGTDQVDNEQLSIQRVKEGSYPFRIDALKEGLWRTSWPGRFECFEGESGEPELVLDGAHNPAGAAALRDSLETYFPGERFTLVFGVFQDKAYQEIIRLMLPLAQRVYTVTAQLPRGMDAGLLAGEVKRAVEQAGAEVSVFSSTTVPSALEEIKKSGYTEKIVVFGSLSLIRSAREFAELNRKI